MIGGLLNDRSSLFLDVDSDRADIDIEATIQGLGTGGPTELGVYAVHRAFTDSDTERGDNCLVGRDNSLPPNFLEMNFDDKDGPMEERFGGMIGNAHGQIRLRRTDAFLSCRFEADVATSASDNVVQPPRTIAGDVAVSATFMRVQVHWVWVVVPRP